MDFPYYCSNWKYLYHNPYSIIEEDIHRVAVVMYGFRQCMWVDERHQHYMAFQPNAHATHNKFPKRIVRGHTLMNLRSTGMVHVAGI